MIVWALIPDWISAIATLLGAIAVIWGLNVAKSTYTANRLSAKALRQSSVAEELIVLSHNIEDAIREMRNPLSFAKIGESNDRRAYYQNRFERVLQHNELFKSLREA